MRPSGGADSSFARNDGEEENSNMKRVAVFLPCEYVFSISALAVHKG